MTTPEIISMRHGVTLDTIGSTTVETAECKAIIADI
jgi:hypothetical protein